MGVYANRSCALILKDDYVRSHLCEPGDLSGSMLRLFRVSVISCRLLTIGRFSCGRAAVDLLATVGAELGLRRQLLSTP